jgi:hypothetical protein
MKKLAAVLTLALAACGGSSSNRPDPAIAITLPAAGASVALGTDADKSVPIVYALTNFTTAAPGSCGGAQNCGHIHLVIDGAACTPAGDLYNNSSNSSTQATAIFRKCATPTGSHAVELQLHDDAHNAVKNNAGQEVKTSVTFTTHT